MEQVVLKPIRTTKIAIVNTQSRITGSVPTSQYVVHPATQALIVHPDPSASTIQLVTPMVRLVLPTPTVITAERPGEDFKEDDRDILISILFKLHQSGSSYPILARPRALIKHSFLV